MFLASNKYWTLTKSRRKLRVFSALSVKESCRSDPSRVSLEFSLPAPDLPCWDRSPFTADPWAEAVPLGSLHTQPDQGSFPVWPSSVSYAWFHKAIYSSNNKGTPEIFITSWVSVSAHPPRWRHPPSSPKAWQFPAPGVSLNVHSPGWRHLSSPLCYPKRWQFTASQGSICISICSLQAELPGPDVFLNRQYGQSLT